MHPTLPYLLTSSDDMLIKLWDWEKACPPASLACILTLILCDSRACVFLAGSGM